MSVFHMKATAKYLLNRSFSNKAQLHLSRHGKRDLCSLEIWPEKHLKDSVSSIFFLFFFFFFVVVLFFFGFMNIFIAVALGESYLKLCLFFQETDLMFSSVMPIKKIFVCKKKVYLIISDFCLS